MEKGEIGNIRSITLGKWQYWLFFDTLTTRFRLFLKTLAGAKLVMYRQDFFFIQDVDKKVLLFDYRKSVPIQVSGDFYNFSVYDSCPRNMGVFQQREHIIYVAHCKNADICYCVLVCDDKLLFAKNIFSAEKKDNFLIDRIILMSGKKVKIMRPIQQDSDGNNYTAEFFIEEE